MVGKARPQVNRRQRPPLDEQRRHNDALHAAAILVRDAAALRRLLDTDCTVGLYVGAMDRLIDAAERLPVEALDT